jgi:hypothetical protein
MVEGNLHINCDILTRTGTAREIRLSISVVHGEVCSGGGKDFFKNKSSPPLLRSRDSLPFGGRFESSHGSQLLAGKFVGKISLPYVKMKIA